MRSPDPASVHRFFGLPLGVVGDDRVGRVEDRLGAAVVLVEHHRGDRRVRTPPRTGGCCGSRRLGSWYTLLCTSTPLGHVVVRGFDLEVVHLPGVVLEVRVDDSCDLEPPVPLDEHLHARPHVRSGHQVVDRTAVRHSPAQRRGRRRRDRSASPVPRRSRPRRLVCGDSIVRPDARHAFARSARRRRPFDDHCTGGSRPSRRSENIVRLIVDAARRSEAVVREVGMEQRSSISCFARSRVDRRTALRATPRPSQLRPTSWKHAVGSRTRRRRRLAARRLAASRLQQPELSRAPGSSHEPDVDQPDCGGRSRSGRCGSRGRRGTSGRRGALPATGVRRAGTM